MKLFIVFCFMCPYILFMGTKPPELFLRTRMRVRIIMKLIKQTMKQILSVPSMIAILLALYGFAVLTQSGSGYLI